MTLDAETVWNVLAMNNRATFVTVLPPVISGPVWDVGWRVSRLRIEAARGLAKFLSDTHPRGLPVWPLDEILREMRRPQ